MKNVLLNINEYKKYASSAERAIIEVMENDIERFVGKSIHEFSNITYTSASTIVRFAKKLGFTGYKDFQKALIYEMALRKESEIVKEDDITANDSINEIINKVTYKNIVSLETSRNLIDPNILLKCLELIGKSHNIYFFGLGSSLLVGHDAYLKFLRVDKTCHIIDDWHGQLIFAKNLKKDDVAIIISYSGLTEEIIKCAKIIKKKGAPIISISRFENSPLARLSTYNLSVAATELTIRSGAMSSRISQLNLVDILYMSYINLYREKSKKNIISTQIKKEESDMINDD